MHTDNNSHAKAGHSFEYDVTFSFAEEDRRFVDNVAAILRRKKKEVFYDKYQLIDTWGKNLYTHLDDIYRNKARFCVMFISEHYKRKLWTRHESISAQARAFKENEEYILPFRFDNTEIPGLLDTVAYLTVNEYNERRLAQAIMEKLEMSSPAPLPLLIRPVIGLSPRQQFFRRLRSKAKLLLLGIVLLALGVFLLADRLTPVDSLARRIHERSRRTIRAICEDDTFSFRSGSGACSHHGGIARKVDSTIYTKTLEECLEEAKQISWFAP